MKPYLMKIITVMVVGLTMYASILLLDKGITNNANEITTLNRKITSLEAINLELESDINNLNMIMKGCLLYTSPSPRDGLLSRMPSSA